MSRPEGSEGGQENHQNHAHQLTLYAITQAILDLFPESGWLIVLSLLICLSKGKSIKSSKEIGCDIFCLFFY